MKRCLIFLLLADAALVFVLQVAQQNAWAWICLYWAILTAKNALDWRDD